MNFARGAISLLKKKAIVKRLESIQNLGAMTVLRSDKVSLLCNTAYLSPHSNIDHMLAGTLTKDEIALSLTTREFKAVLSSSLHMSVQLIKVEGILSIAQSFAILISARRRL